MSSPSSATGSRKIGASERIEGGERIYIGNADRIISRGPHTFRITYNTNRQIRYFDDHDELYWNVTGNGWQFPILRASATVTLPDGVKPQQLAYLYRADRRDGQGRDRQPAGGQGHFRHDAALGAGGRADDRHQAGKGRDPAAEQPASNGAGSSPIISTRSSLSAACSCCLPTTCGAGSPSAAIRRRGVMVPRWDPPDGISPALVNYIDNRGFSGAGWTALSATAIDLAVRGYVVLDDLKEKVVIKRDRQGRWQRSWRRR